MKLLQHWPLVIAVYQQQMTIADYQADLQDWNGWLSCQQRFALLRIFATQDACLPPQGSALLAKEWVKEKRPDIEQWMMGMATVVMPSDLYKKMQAVKAEKFLGIPAHTFADIDTAVAWLKEDIFAAANMTFPLLNRQDIAVLMETM